jgi:hypothetical protein
MADKQPITQIDINNLDALLREGKVDEFYDVLYKKEYQSAVWSRHETETVATGKAVLAQLKSTAEDSVKFIYQI